MIETHAIETPCVIEEIIKAAESKMVPGSGKISLGALEPIIREALMRKVGGKPLNADIINEANHTVSAVFRQLEARGYLVWNSMALAYVSTMNCYRDTHDQKALALHPAH